MVSTARHRGRRKRLGRRNANLWPSSPHRDGAWPHPTSTNSLAGRMRPADDPAASAVVDRAGSQVRSQSSGKSAPTSPTLGAAPDFKYHSGRAQWHRVPCFSLICNAPSAVSGPSATLGFAAAIGAFIDVPVRLANGPKVSIGRPVTGSMRVMTFGSFIVPARTFQLGICEVRRAHAGRKPSTILDTSARDTLSAGALPRTKRLFWKGEKKGRRSAHTCGRKRAAKVTKQTP